MEAVHKQWRAQELLRSNVAPLQVLASYDAPFQSEAARSNLIRLLGDASALVGSDTELSLYTASAYLRLRNYDLALAEIQVFLAAYPEDAIGRLVQANVLTKLGRYREALNTCDLIDDARFEVSVSIIKAGAHSGMGDHEMALSILTPIVNEDEDNARAWVNMSHALAGLGRFTESTLSADRAISIAPLSYEAHHNRAAALQHQKRYRESLAASERALELAPDHSDAHLVAASSLLSLGRAQECQRHLEMYRTREGITSRGVLVESLVAVERGDLDTADRLTMEATQRWPDDEWAWQARGYVLSRVHRHGEAIEAYEIALSVNRRLPMAIENLTRQYCEVAQYSRVLSKIEELRPYLPESALLLYNEAIARACLGSAERAAQCLEEAIRRDPSLRVVAKSDPGLACLREFSDRMPKLEVLVGRPEN
ncbi:MAG: tetratricopeptide repeat protein [Phycisphaerales bacterium]